MDRFVQCVLFLHLFNFGIYLTSPQQPSNDGGAFRVENRGCILRNSTVMFEVDQNITPTVTSQNVSARSTFESAGKCQAYVLAYVNFKDPSQELFDIIADGLIAFTLLECYIDVAYLPSNLTYFRITGYSGCTTQIAISGNITYKLEHIYLKTLPQLPANLGMLRSLKGFACEDVFGMSIDFIIFTKLEQLETIEIARVTGVTGTTSLQLPCLRELNIVDSPIEFVNSTSFEFPALKTLMLRNNSLLAIPEHCSTFENLTRLFFRKNKLQRVVFDKFAKMKQLAILDLSYNEISKITTENLVELPRLNALHINNNKLTQLNVTLWTLMPALMFLFLDGNQLKQVAGLPGLPPSITADCLFVKTSGNPWDCKWLIEVVEEIPEYQIAAMYTNGSCYTTNWFLGRNIRSQAEKGVHIERKSVKFASARKKNDYDRKSLPYTENLPT